MFATKKFILNILSLKLDEGILWDVIIGRHDEKKPAANSHPYIELVGKVLADKPVEKETTE